MNPFRYGTLFLYPKFLLCIVAMDNRFLNILKEINIWKNTEKVKKIPFKFKKITIIILFLYTSYN